MSANPNVTNPDSTILRQSEGMWQKYVGFLLFKLLKKGETVNITVADLQAYAAEYPQGAAVLTHGHVDSIEFSLVTPERAQELAAWDAGRKGRA